MSSESDLGPLGGIFQKIVIEAKGGSILDGVCSSSVEGGGTILVLSVTNLQSNWRGEFLLDDIKSHIDEVGMEVSELSTGDLVDRVRSSLSTPDSLRLKLTGATTASLEVRYRVSDITLKGGLDMSLVRLSDEELRQKNLEKICDLVDAINSRVAGGSKLDQARSKIADLEEKIQGLEETLRYERSLGRDGDFGGGAASGSGPVKEKKVRGRRLKNRSVVNPLMRRRKRRKRT
ncbi:hypothetical protein AAMO2058_000426900 [Amorphochlora amoebiformis]